MGREARCAVRHQGRLSVGRALLESTEIRFRGDFRLVIPFASIQSLSVAEGTLRVRTAAGVTAFDLGPAAGKWAEEIRNPRAVIDKLGVKTGMAVSAIGVRDPQFLRDAAARAATFSSGRIRGGSDLIFLGAPAQATLARLRELRDSIRPDGGIWVVWPRGQDRIKEDHVRAAARAAGLVDVKVVAFSATHSALKLVIPVAMRGAPAAPTGVRAPRAPRGRAARPEAKAPGRRARPLRRESPPVKIPEELERALARSAAARARFEEFPPSHRREIAGFVAEAVKSETRERRAARTVEKLVSGTWKSR
jgi:hypothetical protein